MKYVNEFEYPYIVRDAEVEQLKDLIRDCNHQLEALGAPDLSRGQAFDHSEDLSCVANTQGGD